LGFWGLRKIIERHNAVEPTSQPQVLAALRRGGCASRVVVELRQAAFALSDKADIPPRPAANYVAPSKRIREALDSAGVSCGDPLADWDAWAGAIRAQGPDLLIILGHAIYDDTNNLWSMQIGSGSDLPVAAVEQRFVDEPVGVPGPVVLLFGCVTASEGAEQASFAQKFRLRHASVVIGTTSAVLGRQAGPVAAELIAKIKQSEGKVRLGELLRQIRIEGLVGTGKGQTGRSVMAMALSAFGDADYELVMKGSSDAVV
jgi:hypothetical protein